MVDDRPEHVRLDSAMVRALAHPVRARLLSALRAYGPATSTVLAQKLNTNSGSTSYHLRQLAEVGLIEDDPEHDSGRERWWRAAHEGHSWTETQFEHDPNDQAASEWLLAHYMRTYHRWLEDWMESRMDWPREWREASGNADRELHLTPQGLRALNDEIAEVVQRHRAAADENDPDAQRCVILTHTFPMPNPNV